MLPPILTRIYFEHKIEIMKIVVRVPNWIGDSILSIPAIISLRENFLDAKIWIAAQEWVKDLFVAFDFIEGIIALPPINDLKSMKISSLKLKDYQFDTGLLLTNSFSSALLFLLARIPQRWGYARDGRRILLTKGVPLKGQECLQHQVQYYIDLISDLGLKTLSPTLRLPMTSEERKEAKNRLASLGVNFKKPLILLNPGAYYGSAKRWPASRYAELAVMLQDKIRAELLIIGSSDETTLAESIASSLGKKPFVLTGKTTLRQLVSLISYASLFVTNDSGPMHIANALSVPVVAIFGPTNPLITGPFQDPAIVIKKEVSCWPCAYRECPFDHRCMIKIESEEVYQACQSLLK